MKWGEKQRETQRKGSVGSQLVCAASFAKSSHLALVPGGICLGRRQGADVAAAARPGQATLGRGLGGTLLPRDSALPSAPTRPLGPGRRGCGCCRGRGCTTTSNRGGSHTYNDGGGSRHPVNGVASSTGNNRKGACLPTMPSQRCRSAHRTRSSLPRGGSSGCRLATSARCWY